MASILTDDLIFTYSIVSLSQKPNEVYIGAKKRPGAHKQLYFCNNQKLDCEAKYLLSHHCLSLKLIVYNVRSRNGLWALPNKRFNAI